MDLSKVLEQLRKELEHLNAAIHSLERLQEKVARRGRPPKLLSALRSKARTTQPAPERPQRRRGPAK